MGLQINYDRLSDEEFLKEFLRTSEQKLQVPSLEDDIVLVARSLIKRIEQEGNRPFGAMLGKLAKGEVTEREYLEQFLKEEWGGFLFGIKKWFALNGVKVDWKQIEFPTGAEIREVDRAPSKEELKILLRNASSARDRAAILVLSSSGLRIGTLLSLKVGDVDLTSYPDVARIKVERKRGRKFVGKRRGGQGRVYFTFCTPEAKKALTEYLAARKRAGENLTAKSPLIGDSYYQGNNISVESFEKVWHVSRVSTEKWEHKHRSL